MKMKRDYLKPIIRTIEFNDKEALLSGSDPASLQNVGMSEEEAEEEYGVL